MALLYDDRIPGQPGVHALLIGVGQYPHLGPNHQLGQFAPNSGLEQLTSPLHSVEAFANWLQTDLRVTDTPLRSLRILGSAPDRHAPWQDSEPTFAKIEQYTHDWYDDVDDHEDSLALFYFCGHGLRVGDVHSLLAQDFGASRHNPFGRAIEPEKFANAMRKAKARRQIYLIDACSTSVPLPEDYDDVTPSSVIQAVRGNHYAGKQLAYIRASEFGTKAYGVENQPSVFMASFLEAMKGAAALKRGPAQWVVKTGMLKTALDWLIQRHANGHGQEVAYGAGLSSAVDFHELPGFPLVPVQVSCDPPDFEACSSLHVDNAQQCAAGESPWDLDLAFGKHDFEAIEFDSGEKLVHGQTLAEHVSPPYATVSIPCGDPQ